MVAELVTRALANVQAALAGWPLGGAPAHALKTPEDRIAASADADAEAATTATTTTTTTTTTYNLEPSRVE